MNAQLFSNDRLTVRELISGDIEPFYDMQSNPNVMRYIKPTMDYQQSEKELERFISYYSEPSQFFRIGAAIDNESGHFIGLCGFYKNDKGEYEVAYRLRERFWGIGYGKVMAKATIRYAFEELNLPELVAYVHQDNAGSIRILESQMRFVGSFLCQETQTPERKYVLDNG
jgi:ribosomal-protein-alanine N-acetyltransferase